MKRLARSRVVDAARLQLENGVYWQYAVGGGFFGASVISGARGGLARKRYRDGLGYGLLGAWFSSVFFLGARITFIVELYEVRAANC